MRPADSALILVMGVSGSGKSTVGAALATRLGFCFADADAFHPHANVQKMADGHALTDDDRAPWLLAIAQEIDRKHAAHRPLVLACSALKRTYRTTLLSGHCNTRLVYLGAPRAVLLSRMVDRHHFMPASLLDSQLAVLELPTPDERPIVIDANRPLDEIVSAIVSAL